MKSKSLILILAAVLLLASGCSTTHKATETTKQEAVIETSTSSTTTETNTGQAILTSTTSTDSLNAVVDFVKIEFTDGTEITSVLPSQSPDTAKMRNREATEPPNLRGAVKSITRGHIDLSNHRHDRTKTEATASQQQTTSTDSIGTTTTNISQQSKSTKEPKRGTLYYLGTIAGAVILLIIIANAIYIAWCILKQIKNRHCR